MLYLLTWCTYWVLGGCFDPQPSQELLYCRLGERGLCFPLVVGQSHRYTTICCSGFVFPHHVACGILAPWPGTKPASHAPEAQFQPLDHHGRLCCSVYPGGLTVQPLVIQEYCSSFINWTQWRVPVLPLHLHGTAFLILASWAQGNGS